MPVAFGNVVVCLVISQIRDVANVGAQMLYPNHDSNFQVIQEKKNRK